MFNTTPDSYLLGIYSVVRGDDKYVMFMIPVMKKNKIGVRGEKVIAMWRSLSARYSEASFLRK